MAHLDNIKVYETEDEFKACNISVEVRSPKINVNIRDKSCIVIFPRGMSDERLTRHSVEQLMISQWGELYEHVIQFGNIDFSRKWIFTFDNSVITKKPFQKSYL